MVLDIPLYVTNTLTGKKEPLVLNTKKEVLLYVCGITPYDLSHLGHARVYIFFDVLVRFLTFLSIKVVYCRNFTDIDDKLLDKAHHTYGDAALYSRVAAQYIEAFKEDMTALGCLAPTYEPYVTHNIEAIITFIEELIVKQHAYVVKGNVYFSVHTYKDYGKLSKQRLDELQAGSRVEVSPEKQDPLDFALWKSEKEGTFWKGPWGWGRPGWHIECSALARKYLGTQIDIHGGGADLIFPHHENEIAQSESCNGQIFSKVWLHNAFVQINKEKMSKSVGNFFTIRELFKQTSPMIIRFLMLNHHYRSPIDFSVEHLKSLEKGYQKLCHLFSDADTSVPLLTPTLAGQSATVQSMIKCLRDDLNTVGALGILFKNYHLLATNTNERIITKAFIIAVFGLDLIPLPQEATLITPEIQTLIDQRSAARTAKDWATADALREKLVSLGFSVHDKKE